MNVLAATQRTQGQRASDFSFTDDSELVILPMQCDTYTIDDGCGCQRSFAGVRSRKGTTTVIIAERDMSEDDYRQVLNNAYLESGWTLDEVIERQLTDYVIKLALYYPVGTVLEKRDTAIQVRA